MFLLDEYEIVSRANIVSLMPMFLFVEDEMQYCLYRATIIETTRIPENNEIEVMLDITRLYAFSYCDRLCTGWLIYDKVHTIII